MIPSVVHVSPEVDDAVIVRLLEQGYRVVVAPTKRVERLRSLISGTMGTLHSLAETGYDLPESVLEILRYEYAYLGMRLDEDARPAPAVI